MARRSLMFLVGKALGEASVRLALDTALDIKQVLADSLEAWVAHMDAGLPDDPDTEVPWVQVREGLRDLIAHWDVETREFLELSEVRDGDH